MIGISKCMSDNLPRFVPLQTFYVNQDTLQLHNCECWMGIVQLNGNHIWKGRPLLFGLLETAHDIKQGRGTPKILLF